jgi:hypothetical protein
MTQQFKITFLIYAFIFGPTLSSFQIGLGVLVVICFPLNSRFAGSDPAKDDALVRAIKVL